MKNHQSQTQTHTVETLCNEETGVTLVTRKQENVLDGKQEVFDAQGELIQQYHMRNGKLDGKLLLFEQGIIRVRLHYQQGKRQGESCYFDTTGKKNWLGTLHQ